jgi:chromosome segregation ATPase
VTPKKEADEFAGEIESARREIGDLQKRIHEMVLRRKAKEADAARGASEKSTRKDELLAMIDQKITKAREEERKFPDRANVIRAQMHRWRRRGTDFCSASKSIIG